MMISCYMRDYQPLFCFVSLNQNVYTMRERGCVGSNQTIHENITILDKSNYLIYLYCDVTISHIQTVEVPLTSVRIYADFHIH